ncbi:MAG: hypothetical protein ISR64_04525 [Deltaproteobacteria bacterium]|nr:hypothetical protein [Deltaproteobacteria bacterium]
MFDRPCTRDRNLENCTCTYEPCARKGMCCECIQYHWQSKELPACLFPSEVEKTFDRSLSTFIRVWRERGY